MRKITFFAATSIMVASSLFATATAALAKTMVYVSAATDGDINTYSMDEKTGALTPADKVKAGFSVMPLAVSGDAHHLYAVVRSQPYRVVSYDINQDTGALTEKAVAALPDSMPYVSVEKRGRLLFFASYGGNKIASLPIGAGGLVKEGVKQVILTGRNAHSIVSDKTGKYVFASNLGSDVILQYVLNDETGMLEPNKPASVATKAGQGPRHIRVSPDNKSVYVVTELSGEVIHFALDAATGTLTEKETVPVLTADAGLEKGVAPPAPPAFNAPATAIQTPAPAVALQPKIWAADIDITPDGKFLYASERSTSTIAIFAVAADTGALTRLGSIATEKQPRGIRIDPTGRFLIAAGEKSEKISVYSIGQEDGSLQGVGRYDVGNGANWIEIVRLP
ncbi:6-phosphogluconolactonase [Rhizobium skierniewicense]|uniref:6-phosphogluconolactonase n=1 Tax=Rhizobium skierniewicense TaxID=984260 RepID=A0A7W6C1W9_9HYPH|nr:lactonase family protein [Rhizobium skierniewicense]MBB3944228.1 6-phosphogluconolactonase [Rhizobium skierniewicense]